MAPFKNFAIVLFGRAADYALSFVLIVVLARHLGVDLLGMYFFARSLGMLTTTFSELGISKYTIRVLAGKTDNLTPSFARLLIVRTILTITAIVLLWQILNIINLESQVFLASLMFAIGFGLFQIADLYLDVYRAKEVMHVPVLLTLSQRSVYVSVAIVGIIIFDYGLSWVLIVYVLSNILHLVLCIYVVSPKISNVYQPPSSSINSSNTTSSTKLYYSIIKNASPFAWVVILGAISGKILVLLVYHYYDDETVGYYGAAMHIVEALFYIAYAVTAVAYPNFVRLHSLSSAILRNGVTALTKFLLTVVTPVACITVLGAEAIIRIIYGAEYTGSVILLKICICAAVPGFLNALYITLLQAMGMQKTVAIVMLQFVIILFVLGVILVPDYGAQGAALAFAASELVLCGVNIYVINRFLSWRLLFAKQWKIMVAFIFMLTTTILLTGPGLIAQLIVGFTVYFSIVYYLKIFTVEEIQWIRHSLPSETGRSTF
jgi:O-antigen/teichoic acid export membrane protein